MKIFVAILVVVCATAAFADDDADWKEFKMKHGKAFLSKNTEKKRKQAFLQHNQKFKELSARAEAGEIPYTVSLYSFHDMEPEEIIKTKTGLVVPEVPNPNTRVYRANVHARQSYPDSYDSRDYVEFNAVRDQGQCGSCWTFSSVNTLEVTYTKSKGELVDLSEQQLVDCVYDGIRNGCDGGWMDDAFTFLAKYDGSVTEDLYKYTGVDGKCNYNNPAEVQVAGPFQIGSDDESIKSAIMEYGSISVCVDASWWSYYEGGVFILTADQPLGGINHAVNMVGWGVDEKYGPYWIIRNSWSEEWGENGYIRVSTDPLGTFDPNYSYGVQLP